MNVDSRNERDGVSLEQVKDQLRALSVVEPPRRLKETLRAGIPGRSGDRATLRCGRWWLVGTGWAGIAAAVMVCGVLWLGTPGGRSIGPEPGAHRRLGPALAVDHSTSLGQMRGADYDSSPGRMSAIDYPSIRLPDINALDSNGVR